MTARFSPAVAAAILLLLGHGGCVEAAGIGKAKVVSAAGDPLRVRVELILGPGDRPGRIKAAVASPEIPEDDESNQLWVTVNPAPYGRASLTVRSIAPVEQTSLELLVAVSSPAGRAQRSFTIKVPQPTAAPAGDAAPPPQPTPVQPTGTNPPPSAAPAPPPAAPAPKQNAVSQGLTFPPQAASPTAQDAVARLEDQAALGRLVSLVALGIALVAALGALALHVSRR